jgi:hypothetical protein
MIAGGGAAARAFSAFIRGSLMKGYGLVSQMKAGLISVDQRGLAFQSEIDRTV